MGRNFYYGDGNICGETKNEKILSVLSGYIGRCIV